MVQDQGRSLLDTVAMAVMEIELKDRSDNPGRYPGNSPPSPKEIAANAYRLGMAMVRESLKQSKEWEIVPVVTPEKEEETET